MALRVTRKKMGVFNEPIMVGSYNGHVWGEYLEEGPGNRYIKYLNTE
jgi:hypothetical protein